MRSKICQKPVSRLHKKYMVSATQILSESGRRYVQILFQTKRQALLLFAVIYLTTFFFTRTKFWQNRGYLEAGYRKGKNVTFTFNANIITARIYQGQYGKLLVLLVQSTKGNRFLVSCKWRCFMAGNGKAADDVKIAWLYRGSALHISGEFSTGDHIRNLRGFDEKSYFASAGICGKITAQSIEKIADHNPQLFNRAWYFLHNSLTQCLHDLENLFVRPDAGKTVKFDRTHKNTDGHGLLTALLSGRDDEMSDMMRISMKDLGIYHMTCVSGAHLHYLLLPVVWWKRRRKCRLKLSFAGERFLKYLLCVFLMLIAESSYGVIRAVLLLVLQSFDTKSRRRSDRLNILALVGIIIIFISPFAVRQLGFILSFATAALLAFWETPSTWRWKFLCRDASLVILTMPFVINMQGGFSLLALFSQRIFLLPLCYLSLLGYALLTLLWLLPFAKALILQLASFFLVPVACLFEKVAVFAASQSKLFFCGDRLWRFLLCFLLLQATAMVLFTKKHLISFVLHHHGKYILAAELFVLVFCKYGQGLPAQLTKSQALLYFADVGQAQAVLLVEGDTACLYDGGKPGDGINIILPQLRALGHDRLTMCFLSHGHADHAGGVADLVSYGRVQKLLINQSLLHDKASDSLLPEILFKCQKTKTPVCLCTSNSNFKFGDFSLKVIFAGEKAKFRDANDLSLVLQVQIFGHSVLLTGDITAKVEKIMCQKCKFQHVDVLQVPHHGSGKSSSIGFLSALRPGISVISCGKNNVYGHPQAQTLKNLQAIATNVYRTDQEGGILLMISKDGKLMAGDIYNADH